MNEERNWLQCTCLLKIRWPLLIAKLHIGHNLVYMFNSSWFEIRVLGPSYFFLVSKLFISFKIIILKNLKTLKGRLLLLKSLLFQFFMQNNNWHTHLIGSKNFIHYKRGNPRTVEEYVWIQRNHVKDRWPGAKASRSEENLDVELH